MEIEHLRFIVAASTIVLLTGFSLRHHIRRRIDCSKLSVRDSAPDVDMRRQANRAMIQILCEIALDKISKTKDSGDTQEPVHIAATMVDVTIKTGHLDVLNETLKRVDETWPSAVVIEIWKTTAPVADKLPARDGLWDRFRDLPESDH
jgi:hypothetical protein